LICCTTSCTTDQQQTESLQHISATRCATIPHQIKRQQQFHDILTCQNVVKFAVRLVVQQVHHKSKYSGVWAVTLHDQGEADVTETHQWWGGAARELGTVPRRTRNDDRSREAASQRQLVGYSFLIRGKMADLKNKQMVPVFGSLAYLEIKERGTESRERSTLETEAFLLNDT